MTLIRERALIAYSCASLFTFKSDHLLKYTHNHIHLVIKVTIKSSDDNYNNCLSTQSGYRNGLHDGNFS